MNNDITIEAQAEMIKAQAELIRELAATLREVRKEALEFFSQWKQSEPKTREPIVTTPGETQLGKN